MREIRPSGLSRGRAPKGPSLLYRLKSLLLLVGPIQYHVGDTVQIRFEAGRDCHVYLIDAGTSGGLFLLYPNGYHADSAVTGGREYVVPASGDPYTIPVGGPKGWEGLKIVATLKPLDLGVKPGGAATQIDFDQRSAFARRLGDELRRLKPEEWTVGTWAFRVK